MATYSKSERSKAARARTAGKTQEQIVAAGGWRLTVMLYPPAAEALRAEMLRTGERSAAAVVNRVIEGIGDTK